MDYKDIAEILREGSKRMNCTFCALHRDDTPDCIIEIAASVVEQLAEENNIEITKPGDLIPDKFGFDEAIKQLKRGARLMREGWNGKGQFIELVRDISYKTSADSDNEIRHATSQAIAFHGVRGVQIGWLASQADMLADDWMIWRTQL